MTAQQEAAIRNRIIELKSNAQKYPEIRQNMAERVCGIFGALLDLYAGKNDRVASGLIKFAHDTIAQLAE